GRAREGRTARLRHPSGGRLRAGPLRRYLRRRPRAHHRGGAQRVGHDERVAHRARRRAVGGHAVPRGRGRRAFVSLRARDAAAHPRRRRDPHGADARGARRERKGYGALCAVASCVGRIAMIVVRCVQPGDVDAVVALAQETGPGLTTFKPDREALTARVERARRTLAGVAKPYEAGYLFAMEDTATGDIAGVCGIETEVALEQPFYNYRVSTVVHASKDLGVWTKMSLLNISHDLTGYAEVCSLFLSPRYRT